MFLQVRLSFLRSLLCLYQVTLLPSRALLFGGSEVSSQSSLRALSAPQGQCAFLRTWFIPE